MASRTNSETVLWKNIVCFSESPSGKVWHPSISFEIRFLFSMTGNAETPTAQIINNLKFETWN